MIWLWRTHKDGAPMTYLPIILCRTSMHTTNQMVSKVPAMQLWIQDGLEQG